MAYTGNTVFLNRMELISNPSGTYSFNGLSYSQFPGSIIEPNMDIYGTPILGSYRDSNGIRSYIPSHGTSSCINICYEFYTTSNGSHQLQYSNCSNNNIIINNQIGMTFCAIDGSITSSLGDSYWVNIGVYGLSNSTTLNYNWTNSDTINPTGSSLIITDTTLGLTLKKIYSTGNSSVAIINNHIIKVDVILGQVTTNSLTNLSVQMGTMSLINTTNIGASQSFTFSSTSMYNYTVTSSSHS